VVFQVSFTRYMCVYTESVLKKVKTLVLWIFANNSHQFTFVWGIRADAYVRVLKNNTLVLWIFSNNSHQFAFVIRTYTYLFKIHERVTEKGKIILRRTQWYLWGLFYKAWGSRTATALHLVWFTGGYYQYIIKLIETWWQFLNFSLFLKSKVQREIHACLLDKH